MAYKTKADGRWQMAEERTVVYPTHPSAICHLPSRASRGFTMIEMMVVVSIVGIMTSMIVWNYGDFRSGILASNMAYEAATSVRQAQFYGIGVRAASASGGGFDYGGTYGVEFHAGEGESTYNIFRDEEPIDGVCEGLCACDGSPGECIERITMLQQVEVVKVCAADSDPLTNCDYPDDGGFNTLTVNFTRPRPEAFIRVGNNGVDLATYAVGAVVIRGGRHCRSLTIYQSGQVSVSGLPENACDGS